MGRKLPSEDLPHLLAWLHRYLPDTLMLYEKLNNHIKGNSPHLDFYVDQWPDPQAVIITSNVDEQQEQVSGVYGTNEKAVLSLLGDDTIVDWTKGNMYMWPLLDNLAPVVKALAQDKQKPTVFQPGVVMKAKPQDLKPTPVPKGMKISAVSEEDVNILRDTWDYANAGSTMYIRNQVKYYASVMLTTESGEHVGHMIGKDCGTIGLLYVKPKFRRNGYAKLIVSQLAQKYFDEGKEAYVIVEEANMVSINLHQSLGFKRIPDLNIGRLVYTPPYRNC